MSALTASGFAVPEHVLFDMEREAQADAQIGRAQAIDKEIKARYPNCELVWVGERADAPDLIPARWHIRRRARDQGYMDSYFPWVGDDGEYREPDMGIVTMLERGDLWKRNVVEEIRRKREEDRLRVEKLRAATREENIDTFATHVKSRVNPGVSFSSARPWTNRVKPLPG